MSKDRLFYKDKPLFGMDIGSHSIKVMQVERDGKVLRINGYGSIGFPAGTTSKGVIVNYEALAQATMELFDKHISGKITTRRVAATIPATHAYSRLMNLPANLSSKELDDAVRFETEQYIPLPIDDLYLDYSLGDVSGDTREILVVAVPRKIIDSYVRFFEVVGLELCAIETTISAASRLIAATDSSASTPSILIDLGSTSVDLSIYDKILVVNGTIPGGGDDFTAQIKERLKVTEAEADVIKRKYGLTHSKKQSEIQGALNEQLDKFAKEIRRVIRYYDEKTGYKSKIGQIITMGGGANMPGLTEFLTDTLRLPTKMCSFWSSFELGRLDPPEQDVRSVYVSVAGSALIRPKEIWK